MNSEIKLVFKNYKLLKEGEYNLSNGSIFLIQGPNQAGKSSFVNALKAIMEAKDDTVNPTTFGEKEGYVLGSIPGADGLMYQFRYDYNVEGKRKFTFVGPDGKAIKSVGEMRSIFNYTHFTADEFFTWSLDAKGRAKQKEIIMKLLSEKERAEIAEIDAMINNTSGTKYLQRQNVNREVDGLKISVEKGLNLTAEESKYWNLKNDAIKQFETLSQQKEEIETFISNVSNSLTNYENAVKIKDRIVQTYEDNTQRNNKDILDIETQIEALNKKRLELIEDNKGLTESYNNDLKEAEADVKKYSELIDKKKIEEYRKAYDDVVDPDTDVIVSKGIKTRFEVGKGIVDTIRNIEQREKLLNTVKQTYEEKVKLSNELTNEIETLRKRKTSIIKNSDSIPHEFEIGDDYITVDNVPFVETDLCKSSAVKAVAKLMMKVNNSPIMLMGDAENLGFPILNELKEFAEANGKIMVFAEHVRNMDELKLVCYDDIEQSKPKETESTELF
jgi:energy-coupling factor transporter ATP-binding protein EcfA2